MNGTGGESIYGGTFADEDLERPLDAEGLLCMANKGANTNGSQFFITLRECPHLTGKHVVFGRVIRGFDVVQQIAAVPVDAKSRPLTTVMITNCGELQLRTNVVEAHGGKNEEVINQRKRGRHSRSGSRSGSHTPDLDRKDRKRKNKAKKLGQEQHEDARGRSSNPIEDLPRRETEEEYDARLEREENERIAARRARKLEVLKQHYTESSASENGVRFKGRGRMRYIDPESQ